MRQIPLAIIFIILFNTLLFAQDNIESTIKRIYNESLTNGESYKMLDYLTNKIGGRLSGSPQAAAAVEWSRQVMEAYGFDKVYLQEVKVPHWIRGSKEKASIVNSKKIGSKQVKVCALGNSIGTGPGGVHGNIIEVQNFEELESLGKENIEGKIVFFNRPLDPTKINTFAAYGGAVNQRGSGASQAAKYGAIGTVVRSMNPYLDDIPHTGSLRYDPELPKIPAVAISTNDAELLSSLLKGDPDLNFYFETHCKMLPEVTSYNVIGELTGTEIPEEIIVVGGHLDSWDLGDGAHDDGSGCVQSIEVLRIFKSLGINPKRTIRAVMFMNEENGLRGGLKYAEMAASNNENHIAAMESDRGGFTPKGFGLSGTPEQVEKFKNWSKYFKPYGIHEFAESGGGADIGPLKSHGTALIGYIPDSQRYFRFHHSSLDTFEFVNKRELELGAASMAALVYLIDQQGL